VFEPQYTIHKDGMAGNVCKNLEALGCTVNFLHGKSSEKNRLIDARTKQQLLRMDQDVASDPITFDTSIPPGYDAIVISDYNKGTVTYELIEELVKEVDVPIFVDTKKTDLARLTGCYVKINALEKSLATSLPDPKHLIVTHGGNGAEWDGWVYAAEIVGDVTDVCGAGDTFLASLACKYLESGDILKSMEFANKCSAYVVTKKGVTVPTQEIVT
jgi:bifunctional ADP-heptose synthase (sugar kinase/adenylyltransferase)